VLEAGMGGRLDSTNIIRNPLLSVITGIALDHTDYLGDTVEKIAAEKAGIIKDHSPILYGGEDDSARAVIRAVAGERGSEFFDVDYANIKNLNSTLEGSSFDFKTHENIKIKLLGLYQPKNASLVLSAVDVLRAGGMEIPESAVKEGLGAARWPARFEIIRELLLSSGYERSSSFRNDSVLSHRFSFMLTSAESTYS
jgi:dihydrofolate synthase/folylpolyglutamate synthase